jgi:hypothetical protein
MRRHHLLALSLGAALSLAVVLLLSMNAAAAPGDLTQLVMILDGSDSISIEGWEIVTEGLALAVANSQCIPQDGSVELTVVQFGYEDDTYDPGELLHYAKVEISPTIITAGNVGNVADDIRNIPYGGGGPTVPGGDTPMAHGIRLAAQTVANSPNFATSAKQAINLMTDGVPNVKWPSGDYDFQTGHPGAKTDAQEARNYLLSTLSLTAAQDEFDAEAIFVDPGDPPQSGWLKDTIVYPQPGSIWPGDPGWVREFYTIQDYADSLCEKFQVIQGEDQFDFGDASDPPYASLLASNGARHLQVDEGRTWLGPILSTELDSRQGGDTFDDGIQLQPGPYIPGAQGYFTATVSGNGGLFCAWFDWDQNGVWDDGVIPPNCQYLGPGVHAFNFPVPMVGPGMTWARFRLADDTSMGPTGLATDGEVEDYPVQIGDEPGGEEFEFGDAPDPNYPSLLASNGARHDRSVGDIQLMHLGPGVDVETDSKQVDADQFDDGVTFLGSGPAGGPYALPFVPGTEGAVVVDVTVPPGAGGPGTVCAWFDWNQDSSWTVDETAFCAPLPPGPNQVTFTVPSNALGGFTYARFRLAAQNTPPTGYVVNGEVEDYEVEVEGPPPPPPPVGGMTEPLNTGRVVTLVLVVFGSLVLAGAAVVVWRRRTSSI